MFSNIGLFKSITNSFTCLDKSIAVYHPEIIKQLELKVEIKSVMLLSLQQKTLDSVTGLSTGSKLYQKTLEDSLLKITGHFNNLKQNKIMGDPFYKNYNLKIIPTNDVWVSPWELLDNDINDITDNQKQL